VALLASDTYVARPAPAIYGPQTWGVYNVRTGGDVERCGNYQDALARVTFHNALAARIGIPDKA
jgi:hypothetical protein